MNGVLHEQISATEGPDCVQNVLFRSAPHFGMEGRSSAAGDDR
jgi:hypothetical protein